MSMMQGPPQDIRSQLGDMYDQNIAGKQDPQSVHYVDQTDRPETACQACTQFQEPDRCQSVTGHISPHGTCDLFQPFENGAPQQGGQPQLPGGPTQGPPVIGGIPR